MTTMEPQTRDAGTYPAPPVEIVHACARTLRAFAAEARAAGAGDWDYRAPGVTVAMTVDGDGTVTAHAQIRPVVAAVRAEIIAP